MANDYIKYICYSRVSNDDTNHQDRWGHRCRLSLVIPCSVCYEHLNDRLGLWCRCGQKPSSGCWAWSLQFFRGESISETQLIKEDVRQWLHKTHINNHFCTTRATCGEARIGSFKITARLSSFEHIWYVLSSILTYTYHVWMFVSAQWIIIHGVTVTCMCT